MKSSSIKMAKEHGIKSPREYRDILIHEWFIPKHLLSLDLSLNNRIINSKLLKEYINDGELRFQKKSYSVVWLSGPREVNNNTNAILSFRWSELLDIGYVLVKVYREDNMVNAIPYMENT